MKKTKVENISKIKLEFFLKQNKEDIRVLLGPGESSWCDNGTTTKSMILYNRKRLIKVHDENFTIEQDVDINNDEVFDKLHTTENIGTIALDIIPPQSLSAPDAKLFAETNFDLIEKKALPDIEDIKYLQDNLFKSLNVPASLIPEVPETEDVSFSLLEKAKQETEEYKNESEKKYKGKKRGRKKKRGPKTGSKKNKTNKLPPTIITGTTENQ